MKTLSDWDKLQQRGFNDLAPHLHRGCMVCATGPTGYGKTKLAIMLIEWAEQNNKPWVFYTHRKMLFSQTLRRLNEAGVHPGCRAAGYDPALLRSGQLAMIPSEARAVPGRRELHDAKLVIVDEAHANKSGFAEKMVRQHRDAGAAVIGLTATPVNLGHLYEELVVLCKNSELRRVGGIVIAETYAPDEVDLSDVKQLPTGDYPHHIGKRFTVHQVVGSVYYHWLKLNKHGWPTLLFAPGVRESMWFVDMLSKRGVRAAHIDGTSVYLGEKDKYGDSVIHKSKQDIRDQVMEDCRQGKYEFICNRFVFREGVDAPWLGHVIFATTFGTEDGFVQAGGRVLRSHPGQDRVIVQDHGGNWWRHGSLNEDRVWSLQDTSVSRSRERKKQVEDGESELPVTCPRCKKIAHKKDWRAERGCPHCGHQFSAVVREVYQTDGTLKKVRGDAISRKRTYAAAQKLWNNYYYPSSRSRSNRPATFRQLIAKFQNENPRYHVQWAGGQTVVYDRDTGRSETMGNVPEPESIYWERPVKSVPYEELQRARKI